MDTGDKSAPVTRREFFSALSLVWTFIMLGLSPIMTKRSPIETSVLFLLALLMVINYAVAARRGDMSRNNVVVMALLAGLVVLVAVVAFFWGRIPN